MTAASHGDGTTIGVPGRARPARRAAVTIGLAGGVAAGSVATGCVAARGGAAGVAALVAALPRLLFDGSGDGGGFGGRPVEVGVLHAGSLAALLLVLWLAGSSLVYAGARLTRHATAIRAAGWITLPVVRRVVERGLAMTLTVTTVTGGAGRVAAAGEHPPSVPSPALVALQATSSPGDDDVAPPLYVPTPAGDLGDDVPLRWEPAPGRDMAPLQGPPNAMLPPVGFVVSAPPTDEDVAAAPAAATTAATHASTHEVAAGENLWLIAKRQVASVVERPPSDHEIATYWAHLIERNRGRLRSGDPDLIYPGEAVVCPPVAEVAPELLADAERSAGEGAP